MSTLLFFLLFFLYQSTFSSARRNIRGLHQVRRSARAARINCKQEIETDECKAAMRRGIDSSDCISRCLSSQCHTKIYAIDPVRNILLFPIIQSIYALFIISNIQSNDAHIVGRR